MKKVKTLALLSALSIQSIFANDVKFDSTAIIANVSPDASERNSKDRPVEYIDSERGFDPSVMPVDVNLKFSYIGETTEAEIVVTGAIQTNSPGKLNKIWVTAPSLSKVFKVKINKGANSVVLLDLPVHTAAENFVDSRKKGQKGTAIGLTFKVLVKNNEVGSIQKVFPAHLL